MVHEWAGAKMALDDFHRLFFLVANSIKKMVSLPSLA
jgi:hypothetical protein